MRCSSNVSFVAVTPDEVKALYAQFVSLKGEDIGSSTGLNITAAEFQAALGFRDGGSVFLQRIFQLFDGNGDGVVNFEEFMHSIAVLTPTAAPEARLECESAVMVAVFFLGVTAGRLTRELRACNPHSAWPTRAFAFVFDRSC